MSRAVLIPLLGVAVAVSGPPLAAIDGLAQRHLRAGVDLVALTVTVTDRRERHVTGLSEHDFLVAEDGVAQPLSFFASMPAPLDLAIVLDTSGSMKGGLRLVKEAASGLARTLRAGDRGTVVEVKTGTNVLQPLTEDIAAIERAIHATKPGGDTGLYDSLYLVLQDFARERRERPEIRRQSLVLLSDGADTSSHIDFGRVQEAVRRAGVSIYVITPKSTTQLYRLVHDPAFRSRVDFSMNTLVRDSGGRLFPSVEATGLRRVYGAIADELASQYELAYVPSRPATDGRFRRLSVQVVTRSDAQARSRAGYFAGGAPESTSAGDR